MKKFTIDTFLGVNYENFYATKFPSVTLVKDDKNHFKNYIQSVKKDIDVDLAYSYFYEPTAGITVTDVKKAEDYSDTEKTALVSKFNAFSSYIKTFIKPEVSVDTLKYFFEKNSIPTTGKDTELADLITNLFTKTKAKNKTATPPADEYVTVTSHKNNPKSSFLGKKVGIPATIGLISYWITNGFLNNSNLAAGERFLGIFEVSSNVALTSTTVGLTAAAATIVLAPTIIKLKDSITRKYYANKYGSVSKVLTGEKDLKNLMTKINTTTQELTTLQDLKWYQFGKRIKKHFLTKTNRNRLHHVINTAKTIVGGMESCEDAAELAIRKAFLTSVYSFAEENMQIQRTAYASKTYGSFRSENIDIFAKFNKFCDDSIGRHLPLTDKKAMERDVFYGGLNGLESYTNLSDTDLKTRRDNRLAILPENDKLDSTLIPTTLTPDHQDELNKNRKEGLTPKEFEEKIEFLKNVETLLASANFTSIADVNDKKTIKKLIESGKITQLAEIDAKANELANARNQANATLKAEKENYFNETYTSLETEVKTILEGKINTCLNDATKTLDEFKTTCNTEFANALKEAKTNYIALFAPEVAAILTTMLSTKLNDNTVGYSDFTAACDAKVPDAVTSAKRNHLLTVKTKISTADYTLLFSITTNNSETYADFLNKCAAKVNDANTLKTAKQAYKTSKSADFTALTIPAVEMDLIDDAIDNHNITLDQFETLCNTTIAAHKGSGLIGDLIGKIARGERVIVVRNIKTVGGTTKWENTVIEDPSIVVESDYFGLKAVATQKIASEIKTKHPSITKSEVEIQALIDIIG